MNLKVAKERSGLEGNDISVTRIDIHTVTLRVTNANQADRENLVTRTVFRNLIRLPICEKMIIPKVYVDS